MIGVDHRSAHVHGSHIPEVLYTSLIIIRKNFTLCRCCLPGGDDTSEEANAPERRNWPMGKSNYEEKRLDLRRVRIISGYSAVKDFASH